MQNDLPNDPQDDRVTSEHAYLNRRNFMRGAVLAGSAVVTGLLYKNFTSLPPADIRPQPELENLVSAASQPATQASALAGELTPFESIASYNNFYEFSTSKEGVAPAAERFVTRPWTLEVEGLCRKPRVFDLDEVLKLSAPEERIYRMRCVEAWSMVIPWAGFSLSRLLDAVEPLSDAKYVAFQTLYDPKRMPNQNSGVLEWPYVEGLRMDEAMHPLTLLASGLYGRQLPPQNGAPLRLVIPWKYGFKGIKSIVKIRLVEQQPPTTWNLAADNEYGFYANVNPEVPHPRWSQATEQRIGESGRRRTLMFNGYGEEVAHLYAGMDLARNY